MSKARDVSSRGGLTQVIPTSLSVGSTGSASASANGTITVTNGQWIIANGVFTSQYQNYRVMVNATPSAISDLLVRGVTAGTQNTTGNYYHGGSYMFYTSATINGLNGNGSSFYYGGSAFAAGSTNTMILDVMNPLATAATGFHSTSTSNLGYFSQMNGIFNQSTSFDGIQLYFPSGNITGTIRIYGYNNG